MLLSHFVTHTSLTLIICPSLPSPGIRGMSTKTSSICFLMYCCIDGKNPSEKFYDVIDEMRVVFLGSLFAEFTQGFEALFPMGKEITHASIL
jgi:hypothetical protein